MTLDAKDSQNFPDLSCRPPDEGGAKLREDKSTLSLPARVACHKRHDHSLDQQNRNLSPHYGETYLFAWTFGRLVNDVSASTCTA